jgi:drug/metabolite transporter (DMT)-like permease
MMGPGLTSVRTKRLPIHARRAALGLTGMMCNFASLQLLPLAEQTSISFTMPLFATIMGALILREQVGWQRWSAVVMGFIGVLVVVRPGGNALPLDGSMLTLAWSMLVALISIQIRDLGRTELSTTIVFWFSALSVPPLALLMPWFMTPHDLATWGLLLGIGVSGGVGQIALTASLRFAPVSTVVSLDYLGMIGASLYGWLFWNHLPPAATWIGAPVIIASALFIAWREHRLALARVRDIVV